MKTKFIKNNKVFAETVSKSTQKQIDLINKTNDKKIKVEEPFFLIGKEKLPFYRQMSTNLAVVGENKFRKNVLKRLINQFDEDVSSVIASSDNDLYNEFYKEGRDYVFSPGLENSVKWNPLKEIYDISYDLEGNETYNINMNKLNMFMSCLIHVDSSLSYSWNHAAKKAGTAIMITILNSYQKATMKDLFKFMSIYSSREEVVEKVVECGFAIEKGFDINLFLSDSEAGSNVYKIFQEAIFNLIKSDLALDDEECDFSVEEFIKELLEKKSKLFVNGKEQIVLSNFMLKLVSEKLLELGEDENRKIVFSIEDCFLNNNNLIFFTVPELGRRFGIICLYSFNSFFNLRFDDFYDCLSYDQFMNNFNSRIIHKEHLSISSFAYQHVGCITETELYEIDLDTEFNKTRFC